MARVVRRRPPCKTCRERKVRCDRTKPQCQRCKKAYLSCEGYEDSMTFVNFTKDLAPSSSKQIPRSTSSPKWHNVVATRYRHRHPSQLTIGPWLDLSPYIQDFCMSHLTRKVFVGGPPGQQQEGNSWVLTALRRDETSVTHFAAFGVAKAYFARLYEQTWLLADATQDYGKALQHLNLSLESPTSAVLARHLVAMFLLVFYELLCPTSHAGLHYHYSGIATLIQSQSPMFYQTQPNLGYFMQARVLIISGALLSSKKTFVAEHDWKVIPWSGKTFKSLYHEIWDHLSDVVTLLEEFESLKHTKGEDITAYNLFSHRVDSTVDTIKSWRRRWNEQNCGKIFHVGFDWRQTLLPRVDPIAMVSSALAYVDQQCAREIMLYHTALLHLYRMTGRCQTRSQSPLTSPLYLERGSPDCSLHHVTWQIILSVDYLMTSSRVKAGMSFLTLAADAMLRCYKSAEWLVDLVMRMADISGYHFFRELLKYHIPHAFPVQ